MGTDGAVGGAACRLHAKQPTARRIATPVFITLDRRETGRRTVIE
jgi:hypothetical protein